MLIFIMSIDFSLVLPCFNEEENITHLFDEFSKLPLENEKVEIIFVNNGSTDDTEKSIDEAKNKNTNKNISVKKINLNINKGYGGGIEAGLRDALGNYIGWSHADLQTPLIDFYKLYKLIKDKKNVLGKGVRINNRGYDGIISRLHEKCASIILGFEMKEINAQPKIFHKDLLNYFDNMPKQWTVLDTYVVYVCLKKNIKIEEINVVFKNRLYGSSKWKNNIHKFIKTIFFNFLYLFKLRFSKN